MSEFRTFFNVFPKSGMHLLVLHREDLDICNHVPMLAGGEFPEPAFYCGKIYERFPNSFTGHIPYSDEVNTYLRDKDYRIVFIYRDLRDAAVSLADHARMGGSELGVMQFDRGGPLKHRDLIAECIPIIASWWGKFTPWLDYADATYRYRELRGAALLLGHEGESSTFNHGTVGEWRKRFKPYHVDMAKEYFGEWYEMP